MAVGLSCAGRGMPAAVSLLEPLLTDATDFVRQGALIATALVLIQQPESQVCAPWCVDAMLVLGCRSRRNVDALLTYEPILHQSHGCW